MQRTCFFGSPDSQLARWLMIVSIATVVLPVLRSPMISWRWPAADRGHRVDRLDAGLQRLLHRLARHHVRRLQLELAEALVLDLAEAVDRLAERVDHAAEERVADRHREHPAGALDLLALLDAGEVAEDARHRSRGRRGSARRPACRPRTPAARWPSSRAGPRRGRCRRRPRRRCRPPRGRPRASRTRRSAPARPGSRPTRWSARPCALHPCIRPSCSVVYPPGRARSACLHRPSPRA